MKLFQAFGQFAGSGGGAAVITGPGMVLVSPSSITYSGTSASIGANGFITVSNVTSLSINGVFTSTYDDYVIVTRATQNSSALLIDMKMRSAGTDATASDYNYQYILSYGTTKTASRSTSNSTMPIAYTDSVWVNGAWTYLSAPALPLETSFRFVSAGGNPSSNAFTYENAGFHDVKTSYDGCTLSNGNGVTGTFGIYGIRT